MEKSLQTVGHVVGAVISPIGGFLRIILGLGAVLALVGVVGTLAGAAVLHLLSPNATVSPLLRLAAIAALGGVGFFAACSLPGIAPSKRR